MFFTFNFLWIEVSKSPSLCLYQVTLLGLSILFVQGHNFKGGWLAARGISAPTVQIHQSSLLLIGGTSCFGWMVNSCWNSFFSDKMYLWNRGKSKQIYWDFFFNSFMQNGLGKGFLDHQVKFSSFQAVCFLLTLPKYGVFSIMLSKWDSVMSGK